MSEIFEGLIAKCPASDLTAAILAAQTDLRFQVFAIGPYAVAERIAGRNDSFSADLTEIAAALSRQLDPVVTFEYDSRAGHRAGAVYVKGVQQQAFGEMDEQWVPLDEDGSPIVDAVRSRLPDLEEDEEYETIMNAIDLALDVLAGDDLRWRDVHDRLSEAGRLP